MFSFTFKCGYIIVRAYKVTCYKPFKRIDRTMSYYTCDLEISENICGDIVQYYDYIFWSYASPIANVKVEYNTATEHSTITITLSDLFNTSQSTRNQLGRFCKILNKRHNVELSYLLLKAMFNEAEKAHSLLSYRVQHPNPNTLTHIYVYSEPDANMQCLIQAYPQPIVERI